MGDMADYYQEQDEMRAEEQGRNIYRNPQNNGSRWDELDHILGYCDCLPPHAEIYSGQAIKAKLEALIKARERAARIDELNRMYDIVPPESPFDDNIADRLAQLTERSEDEAIPLEAIDARKAAGLDHD